MKLKKMDLILILVVVALAIGGMLIYRGFGAKEAGTVIVEVDGEAFGEYSLDENHEILINDTNVLIIENGQANMYEANCPDQICVKHTPISGTDENIICLPNKVVVTIEDIYGKNQEAELDAVVK